MSSDVTKSTDRRRVAPGVRLAVTKWSAHCKFRPRCSPTPTAAGGREALRRLLSAPRGRGARVLPQRAGSAELAADLTAETFARALEGRRASMPAAATRARGCSGSRATCSAAASSADAWRTTCAGGWGWSRSCSTMTRSRGSTSSATRRRWGAGRIARGPGAGGPRARARRAALRGTGTTAACSESVVRQRVSRGLRALRAELRSDE